MPSVLRELDLTKAMPGMLARLEENGLVEVRGHGLRVVVRRVPGIRVKLEAPTPLLRPLGAEVDDQIQPAMPAFGVIVEVNVRVQTGPIYILMRASAVILRVIKKAR